MIARERVQAAINHTRPDRTPIDHRAVQVINDRLMAHYQVDYESLLERLHVDFREASTPYIGPPTGTSPTGSPLDIWGVGKVERITEQSRDVFTDYNPLSGAEDIAAILAHPWPTADMFDYSGIAAQCERYKDYAVSTPGIHSEGYLGVFHKLTYLFGMEEAMMMLISDEELVRETINQIMRFFLQYYERVFESAKGGIGYLFYKDDFGSQNSLMISRQHFLKYFAPCIKQLADLAKSYGASFIMHSCGSVDEIIPDFIEAGVAVLDPIQTSAKNMGIDYLKQTFGERITFHGGIDTQQFLPNSTPEEVRETVAETIRIMGKDGGYLFTTSHRIQQDTPLENVFAMYDTAAAYRDY